MKQIKPILKPANDLEARQLVTLEVGQAPSILIACGEASSDEHTAKVISEFKKIYPEARFFGMGGSHLRDAGVETVVDSETHASVMGFTELSGSIKKLYDSYKLLLAESKKRKPELAILVDFPDFNLRLAKTLHAQGVKILYFISPQLWAWRKGRVHLMKKYVDAVATIFPFEEEFYLNHNVRAEYVGHPFLDVAKPTKTREEVSWQFDLNPSWPTLALLPGSRRAEVERLLPEMLGALRLLRESRPELQAILPVAPTLSREWIEELTKGENITLVSGQAREVLFCSTVAVVASGTITVEAALAPIPFVVVYKLSAFSYFIARLLVKGIKYFSMANLIAEEKVTEELLQAEVTAENIALQVERFLKNPRLQIKTRDRLGIVREKLQHKNLTDTSAKRTARLALEIIQGKMEEERKVSYGS